MDSIGAEVGQKMRSAIKAKLMELDCYVDEELPDYIMVMVANRRTKSQMTEDLNLFLSAKTATFVNWLHIVLKKLKEVTVTNPEVYKKALKRKSNNQVPPDDKSSLKLKKEKTHKKVKKEGDSDKDVTTSMTDDLPITVSNLSKNRKIIVESSKEPGSNDNIVDDNFDIPLLSEVADSVNEQELQDIEKKIKSVKSRLGLLVDSDGEVEDPDFVKSEYEDTLNNKTVDKISTTQRKIMVLEDDSVAQSELEVNSALEELKPKHKRIVFENDSESRSKSDRRSRESYDVRDRSPNRGSSNKKPSILDRLGKRPGSLERSQSSFLSRDDRSTRNREDRSSSRGKLSMTNRLGYQKGGESSRYRNRSRSRSRSPLKSKNRKNDLDKDTETIKEGILSRLGVQSKVAVVKKTVPHEPDNDEEAEEKVVREVQSSIKVKPRVIPSDAVQPNKNLLLKAVAEAQRSIAQTPKVGKDVEPNKPVYKERPIDTIKKNILHRLSPKPKVKDIIKESSSRMRSRLHMLSSDDEYDSEGEYVPKNVRSLQSDTTDYVPASKTDIHTQSKSAASETNGEHQFIITLDGIENIKFSNKLPQEKSREKSTSNNKRGPSPIIFNKTEKSPTEKVTSRPDIPDILPVVRPPLSIKNKERCKYWPGCKLGDRCEFVHPSESCQLFPHCKFGDRCIFLHPKCKFAASCTKRDCPYDHGMSKPPAVAKALGTTPLQNCKFFPNCANAKCQYYHPKPCKYGKFCNNMATCTFSHAVVSNRKNFSWTAK